MCEFSSAFQCRNLISASAPQFAVDNDIDTIIQRREKHGAELNSKYESLSFNDLNAYKPGCMMQQEGQDEQMLPVIHFLLRFLRFWLNILLLFQRSDMGMNLMLH